MKAFLEMLKAWGPGGVLALAIVESAGIPNPGGTDALLLFLTISNPARAWTCAALATVGSLIGSAIFYRVIRKGGEIYLDRRTSSGRGAKFKAWFLRYGLATVFVCALLPIPVLPLKAFILCAAAMGVPMRRYLLVMLAARLPRYFGLAYLGRELGEHSSAWLKQHVWHMAVFAALLFVFLFLVIRLSERRSTATA